MDELKCRILKIYEDKGLMTNQSNTICDNCIANKTAGKLGMWHCGKNAKGGIMFVGKTAVTSDKVSIPEKPCKYITGEEYKSNFWNYIIQLSKEKYGENNYLDNISVTNLVKCNYNTNEDRSTEDMVCKCLDNKYLLNEIKIIKPKYIVLLWNNWYKEFFLEKEKDNIKNIKDNGMINIGQKKMPKCTFDIYVDNEPYKCLLIGHPGRYKKDDYLNVIREFIR